MYVSVTGFTRTLTALSGLLAATALTVSAWAGPGPQKDSKPTADVAGKSRAATKVEIESFGKRERGRFLENKGQWASEAQFLGRARNLDYWVTRDGVVLDQYRIEGKGDERTKTGHVVKMRFEGSADAIVSRGKDVQKARTSFVNVDSNKTVDGARSYGEVWTNRLYPGIAARHYFDEGRPRYDLVVEPGMDPGVIAMRFDGATRVEVDEKGALAIGTSLGGLRHHDLHVYQEVNGKKVTVPSRFGLNENGSVRFRLGEYDATKPLVIDPVVYGSYYGGDSGFDEVRAVVSEANAVYLTGLTAATDFPAVQGPYSFNLTGAQDGFITKFQGDAYSHDFATYITGTLEEVGDYIQLDPFGNAWVAGRTFSSDFPGNTRNNVQFIRSTGDTPTGGTFQIGYGGATRVLPFNATAADIYAALDSIPALTGLVVEVTGGPLPNGEVRVVLDNSRPGRITLNSAGMKGGYSTVIRPMGSAVQLTPANVTAGTFTLTINGETTAPINFNATATQVANALAALPSVGFGNVAAINGPVNGTVPVIVRFLNDLEQNPQPLTVDGALLTGTLLADVVSNQFMFVNTAIQSIPNSGTFTATFGGVTTDPQPFNVGQAAYQTALQGLTSIGQNNVFARGFLPQPGMYTIFGGTLIGPQQRITVDNAGLGPNPTYSLDKPHDLFVIRFAQSTSTVLDPLPTRSFIFGGERNETMTGFKIVPKENPSAADPVELVFSGYTSANNPLPEISGSPLGTDGWMLRVNFANDAFSVVPSASRYMGNTAINQVTGLDVDDEGNAYVVGTVASTSVVDTSLNPVFQTTPGVYENGRLLRFFDAWIRKYDRAGNLLYSALLGGNGSDQANGVAVDRSKNAYITGIARSFNFPRTRDVYGENFTASNVVYVTKVNQDASQILYSTHLNTGGPVVPRGIAVDQAGRAFVSVLVDFSMTFPQPPGDPNQPTAITPGTIPTSPDAIQATNTQPATTDMGSLEGGLLVLSPNARTLVHGTYIGGILDDEVYAPYTDKFGDVWLMGYTENYRQYQRVSSTGAVTVYTISNTASLPTQWISATAFKTVADAAGFTTVTKPYGLKESPFTAPATISASVKHDGFLVKLRFGLASIQDITFDPSQIAGGFGNFSTGTVTLTQASPAGGLDVTLNILNGAAASFSPATDVTTAVIQIPEGATSATFTIYGKAVTSLTPVQVKASAEGNFQIGVLTVAPWLTSISISPPSVVGGNAATGRVRLFQAAPAGGVTVNLTTNNAAIVKVPATITVPAGQETTTFTINTEGVVAPVTYTVTASLLGVGRTENLSVTPPDLSTLTFTPSRVSGGTSSVGRLSLNGKAGGNFTVNLSIDAGTAGYVLTPNTLTFAQGDTFKEFTVTTVYELQDTQRRITANRPAQGALTAQSVSGVLFIDAVDLTTFTLDKASVAIGETATGKVTIGKPAGQGGVRITLSSNRPGVVTVPASVVVPTGLTEVNFTVTTVATALNTDTTATLTATRGPITLTRDLTVRRTTMGVTVDPFIVVAGNNALGTVSVAHPAPAGGLVVNLQSNNPSVTVPATVTIPANQRSATFQVRTTAATVDATVTITATSGQLTAQTTFNLLAQYPFEITNVTFDRRTVLGGNVVNCTITIDAAAPAGGLRIDLESSNERVLPVDGAVTIPAGQTSVTFSVTTGRVSRNLSVRLTARYKESVASALLAVTRI